MNLYRKLAWLCVLVLFTEQLMALEINQNGRFGESLMEVRLRSLNNTGSDEIYAGVPSIGTAANRTQTDHTWATDNWIEINYDQMTDILRVSIYDGLGTVINSLDYPNWQMNMQSIIGPQFSAQNLNALQISIFNRELQGELSFEDVELDGVAVGGDFDIPAGQTVPNITRWVFSDYCFSSFNLYGRLIRTGVFTNSQELAKVEFRIGTDNPRNEVIFENGFEFCFR